MEPAVLLVVVWALLPSPVRILGTPVVTPTASREQALQAAIDDFVGFLERQVSAFKETGGAESPWVPSLEKALSGSRSSLQLRRIVKALGGGNGDWQRISSMTLKEVIQATVGRKAGTIGPDVTLGKLVDATVQTLFEAVDAGVHNAIDLIREGSTISSIIHVQTKECPEGYRVNANGDCKKVIHFDQTL